MINVKDFKGAIIQYTCEDCLISQNFNVYFSNIQKIESGKCSHFDINMLLINDRKEIKYSFSFRCKNCGENKIIELFNTKTNDISETKTYSCQNCKQGNMTFGFLLENDLIDLEEDENIKLVFCIKDINYNVYVEPKCFIPEAFSILCKGNNNDELKGLNVRAYIKDGNELDKYTSIKDLNLNYGDKIIVELRGNCGWDGNN